MNDLDRAAARRLIKNVAAEDVDPGAVLSAMIYAPVQLLFRTYTATQLKAMYETAVDLAEDGAMARKGAQDISLLGMTNGWIKEHAPHLIHGSQGLTISDPRDFDLYTFAQSVPFLLMLRFSMAEDVEDIAAHYRGTSDQAIDAFFEMMGEIDSAVKT